MRGLGAQLATSEREKGRRIAKQVGVRSDLKGAAAGPKE